MPSFLEAFPAGAGADGGCVFGVHFVDCGSDGFGQFLRGWYSLALGGEVEGGGVEAFEGGADDGFDVCQGAEVAGG